MRTQRRQRNWEPQDLRRLVLTASRHTARFFHNARISEALAQRGETPREQIEIVRFRQLDDVDGVLPHPLLAPRNEAHGASWISGARPEDEAGDGAKAE